MRAVLPRDVAFVAEIDRRCVGDGGVGTEAHHRAVTLRGHAESRERRAGAPARVTVTGRLVSAYSWLQPSRNCRTSFSRQPRSMAPPSWAPITERSELVVWALTVRLSDCAPVSVKAFCVPV